MNVVVDERVAILKVLALADAVGSNQQIDLSLGVGIDLSAFFRHRGESRQEIVQIRARPGQSRFVGSTASNKCAMNSQLVPRPIDKMGIEILRGIGEGGENDDLLVSGV